MRRPAAVLTLLIATTTAYGQDGTARRLLIIDLEGDGLHLTDAAYPVRFDVDGRGVPEALTWTAHLRNDGFLWWDEDADGAVDGGAELLGSAFRLGGETVTAFSPLARWDRPEAGGNDDGAFSPLDAAWSRLRVWIDRDHDGAAGPDEVQGLDGWGIERIRLEVHTGGRLDGNLNRLLRHVEFEGGEAIRPGAGRGRIVEVELRSVTPPDP